MPVVSRSGLVERDSSFWAADPTRCMLIPTQRLSGHGQDYSSAFRMQPESSKYYSEGIASIILERVDPFSFLGRGRKDRLVSGARGR